MEHRLEIGLFDPGMSHIHRVGLAGLYMTLKQLSSALPEDASWSWELQPDRVILLWEDSAAAFFEWLFSNSFGFTKAGIIEFAAHRAHAMGDEQRVHLHKAILNTYLQHNKQNRIPKATPNKRLSYERDSEMLVVEYKPLVKPYAHITEYKNIIDKKGRLKENVRIKGWLYPGASERHSALTGTEWEESASRFICLLFSPVASLYFKLSHRGLDGKFDKRRSTAIVLPHIENLGLFSISFNRYLESPVDALVANGVGDAGLQALVCLRAGATLSELGITGCSILSYGTVGWSKQQKTRTRVFDINEIDERRIDRFEFAWKTLLNQVRVFLTSQDSGTEYKSLSISPSLCRGLIAENIALGKEWFRGFADLMRSKELAKRIYFEKGGLAKMVKEFAWDIEDDKLFIEAVHAAVRNRYGALAAQARQRGERVDFGREFTRMRTGLMRVKNAQTLRAEISDLLARGGLNRSLQEGWQRILPLIVSADWQRTRDLALLALASYSGKGAEEVTEQHLELDEEE